MKCWMFFSVWFKMLRYWQSENSAYFQPEINHLAIHFSISNTHAKMKTKSSIVVHLLTHHAAVKILHFCIVYSIQSSKIASIFAMPNLHCSLQQFRFSTPSTLAPETLPANSSLFLVIVLWLEKMALLFCPVHGKIYDGGGGGDWSCGSSGGSGGSWQRQ